MGLEWGNDDWDDGDPWWDSGSRDRQNRLIVLIAICVVVTAVLYLTFSEPAITDDGRPITTTTEAANHWAESDHE